VYVRIKLPGQLNDGNVLPLSTKIPGGLSFFAAPFEKTSAQHTQDQAYDQADADIGKHQAQQYADNDAGARAQYQPG
jgi:hypothetical protein